MQVNKPPGAGSSNTATIGGSNCPNIHAATRPGHFQGSIEEGTVTSEYEEPIDYSVEEYSDVADYEQPLDFKRVNTPEALQVSLPQSQA